MKSNNIKKRGQVTIFIIIAIILVAMIALFIFFRSGLLPELPFGKEVNPTAYMKSCIEDELYDGIEELSYRGGKINDDDEFIGNFFIIEEEDVKRKIAYLCYTGEIDGRKCTNLYPFLIGSIEDELIDYISEYIEEDCYGVMINNLNLESDKSKYNDFDLKLTEEGIEINLDMELTLEKNEEIKNYDDFNFKYSSSLYSLLKVAHLIVEGEATNCDFDSSDYMFYHKDISIKKFPPNNGNFEVYTIRSKSKDSLFRFAVKGCLI